MRTASDDPTREGSTRGLYVGYDLETPEHDHQELVRALEALHGRRVDTDLWVVEGTHTPQELFDKLSRYIRGGDILAVEHLDGDAERHCRQCACRTLGSCAAGSPFDGDSRFPHQTARVH